MKKILVLLLLCSVAAFAQKRQSFKGQVLSQEAVVPGIFVINKTTGAETKTDNNGLFTLEVKTGDKLAVYSDKIKARDFSISDDSFKEQPYKMSVDLNATELKEVVVEDEIRTEEQLGLVPEGQKQYTPAERRKRSNRTFSLNQGLNIGGDGIGKHKKLKENVSTEKKIQAVDNLKTMYSEEQIVETFGIPADNVDGFMYYAAEDDQTRQALLAKSSKNAKPNLQRVAKEYLELLQDEN